MKKTTILLLQILMASIAFSQGIAINNDGSDADGSALLDVQATDKGVLVPRVSQSQRDGIASPATGLLVYQTDNEAGFYYYNGSQWTGLGSGSGQGSCGPRYLGEEYLGGVVFHVWCGDGGVQHGLVVSTIEVGTVWQTGDGLVGANRSWDGAFNTGLMAGSPAKDWITTNFTSEWYLPGIDELSLLWQNKYHVNQALHIGGYNSLSSISGYWSSTEVSATEALGHGGSGISGSLKDSMLLVRAIRFF